MAEKLTGKPLVLRVLAENGNRMKLQPLKGAYFLATGRGHPGEPMATALVVGLLHELLAEKHIEASYVAESVPREVPLMDEVWLAPGAGR